MNLRPPSFGLVAGLLGSFQIASFAATATFDDLPSAANGNNWALIDRVYFGLRWENFGVLDGTAQTPDEGYYTGVVSSNNVAFNLSGNPAAITCGTLFDLHSAYLTEQVSNSMQLQVLGWTGSRLAYNRTYSLTPIGPSLLELEYRGVDRVEFIPSPLSWFAMDNVSATVGADTNVPSCGFTLSQAIMEHGASAETGTVSVVTQTGCAWAVLDKIPWITLLSSHNNSGSGVVTYRVAPNPRATPRSGVVKVADQLLTIRQSAGEPSDDPTPVNLGTVEVSSIGHSVFDPMFPAPGMGPPSLAVDFLIDQDQSSGGGAVLPAVSTGWDTKTKFTLTVAAPAGQKILISPPAGRLARFGGFLIWESTRGGESPIGPVSVSFTGLEGVPPDFAGSDAVLSDSQGFFGFTEVTSSEFTNELAFTSMTLTGTVSPQYTGFESQDFVAHHESSLQLSSPISGGGDTGPIVSIVPATPAPLALKIQPTGAGGLALMWASRVGVSYQLQVKASPTDLTWKNSGPALPGTGGQLEGICESDEGFRLFRVVEVP